MLERLCFSLLILQSYCLFQVSALENEPEADSEIDLRNTGLESSPLLKVEYEIGRAAYIPSEQYIARGEVKLHCYGPRSIADKIYWSRNGVKQEGAEFHDDPNESTVQSIYRVASTEEARYNCNGLFLYMIKPQPAKAAQNVSVYKDTEVTCIDRIQGEDGKVLEKVDTTGEKTSVELFSKSVKVSFWPIKERKIESDLTFKCNNTEAFTFMSVEAPTTSVAYKGKKVYCTSTDNTGSCQLFLSFGDKVVATGVSPTLIYKYNKINIKQVTCKAVCLIGDTLPVTSLDDAEIEINRTLYICVILAIILIIIILIIIVICVLWHQFGFKEKYGYQINMRLKKNFAVDTNKLSSYRVSGVQPDVPVELDGSDPDVVKEFRDMDDGSLDDSFVDPNFARTNNKFDMRSKDDISSSGASNQRPFLRI